MSSSGSHGSSDPTAYPAPTDPGTQTIREAWFAPVELPEQIGPYKILSVLGEGGMGVVYVAEQRQPVQRRVAIKVIKLGMDTRDVIARFEAERQALAMMDHPNIARVYDAGATETGRPYFAMELVSGVPITRYCDDKMLSTTRRLELFAQVCDAVQHAHTKGIIHRDIKPGNVLITETDGKPVPKIIDFGVAKATNQRLTEHTLFTRIGFMVGTPEYMSPEQADAMPLDVDTRTDVYSLGVMFYELLTGALPFDAQTMRSAAYNEIQRIIREVEPPRPSTRLTKLGDQAKAFAKRRHESVDTLAAALRRELEWIPLKAMRKERDARYRTASELADDVRNYLTGRPLIAGPESQAYRAKKFLKRNRAPVAAAVAMVLLLIAGAVTTTYQAIRARRAEKLALLEKQRAEARFNDVRALAKGLLFDLQPLVAPLAGSTNAVRKIMDLSLEYLSKLQAESSNDVGLIREVAAAYDRLGDIQGNAQFKNVGDADAAMKSYAAERAMAERARTLAPHDPMVTNVIAISDLKFADMLRRQGKNQEAMDRLRKAQAAFDAVAAARPDSFVSQFNVLTPGERIADLQMEMGDAQGALDGMRAFVEKNKRVAAQFPKEPQARSLVYHAMDMLAMAQRRMGDYQGAAQTMREVVAHYQQLHDADPDDAQVAMSLAGASTSLARLLMNSVDLPEEAEALLAKSRALETRIFDADPKDAHVRELLAEVMLLSADCKTTRQRFDDAHRDYDAATQLYRDGLKITPSDAIMRRMLIVTLGQRANLEEGRGDLAGSIRSQEEVLAMLQPMLDADPKNPTLRGGRAFSRAQIAGTLLAHGLVARALEHARGAVAEFDQLIQDSPQDAQAKTLCLSATKTLLQVLDAVITDRKTTGNERAQLRQEAHAAATNAARLFGELKQAKALAANTPKVAGSIQSIAKDIDDDSRIGATTRPTSVPSEAD